MRQENVKDISHGKQNMCPHWKPPKCASTISNTGIFIPLNHKIKTNCESNKHSLCPQYTANDAMHSNSNMNKRKTKRIKNHHPITILHLNQAGDVIDSKINEATIVDMSQDGMSLKTNTPIYKDSLIQFFLNDSSQDNLNMHFGLAVSKWCSEREDKGYHIGFAFHSKETARTMDDYLNLLMSREKSD